MISFRSAKELHNKVAQLPKPPAWKYRTVKVEGGTTATPIKFFFREAMEVFRFLFGNPIFANHQDIVPMQVWEDEDQKVQILEGPMTGRLVYEIQVSFFTTMLLFQSNTVFARTWSAKGKL